MLIHAVPCFQGAVGPRAHLLPAGCAALAGLASSVLGSPVVEVPVPAGRSSTVDGIANREVLVAGRPAQLAALQAPGGPVLTIGGDCGVELVPVGVARYRYGPGLGVAWFDAHADLNTASSSPSGAFHGMVLRSLLGEGDPEFAAAPALERGHAVLIGTRAFDPAERDAVAAGLVRRAAGGPAALRYAGVGGPAGLRSAGVEGPAALRSAGVERVYVHVDLDVLDPAAFPAVGCPEPGGLSVAELVEAIRSFAAFEVVGAGITECAVADPGALRPLLPVLEALGGLLTG